MISRDINTHFYNVIGVLHTQIALLSYVGTCMYVKAGLIFLKANLITTYHDQHDTRRSNRSHGQATERISNENDFWLGYGYFTVHVGPLWSVFKWATLKLYTSSRV